jgi:hypothetical protein
MWLTSHSLVSILLHHLCKGVLSGVRALKPPAVVACKAAPTQPCSPPAPPALALAAFVLSQAPLFRLLPLCFDSASLSSPLLACTVHPHAPVCVNFFPAAALVRY